MNTAEVIWHPVFLDFPAYWESRRGCVHHITHKPKGTGLGLAIVKKIMEDHSGRVLLEDRPPREDWTGPGTLATLCLPVRTSHGA